MVVLALPRGGVPVAFEVAEALDAPLDVFLVRKLGVPGHDELAMGAIASGGVRVLNEDVVRWSACPGGVIEAVERKEQARTGTSRTASIRSGRPLIASARQDGDPGRRWTRHRLDDEAAAKAARQLRPARFVVAVPVGSPAICQEFADDRRRDVCARDTRAVLRRRALVRRFSQTTDDEVRQLLASEHATMPVSTPS